MSLIAHFPLKGNLQDFSGNGYVATGTPAINNYGKIGKTYDFSSNYLTMDYRGQGISMRYNNSICFWIKLKAIPASGARFGVFETAYGAEWAVNVAEGGSLQLYYGTSGSETTPYTSTSSNFGLVANVWFHVAIVRNIDNNTIEWYKNGNLLQQTALAYIPSESSTSLKIGRSYTGNLNGYLNDFRIYDHALSEKEVYEIAKAKVLHYSFDDPEEPTVNLSSNPTFDNGTTDWAISNANSGSYQVDATGGVFDNKNTLRINVSNGGDQYQHHSYYAGSNISGKPFTVSAYIKAEDLTGNVVCSTYWKNSSGGWIWANMVTSTQTVQNRMGWTRISASSIAPADCYYATIIIAPTIKDGLGKYWIDAVQIEQKPHLTEYVETIREAAILDYSGYDNHQAIDLTSSPKWISDSARGLGAYEFFTTSKIITPFEITNDLFGQDDSSFTLFLSLKLPEATSGQGLIFGGSNQSGFGISVIQAQVWGVYQNANGTYYASGSSSLTLNQYYRIALKVDKNLKSMSFFVNGVRNGSVTPILDGAFLGNSFLGINNSLVWFTGLGFSQKRFICDDIKLYMTAFTDAQILAEYQERASLDKKGNLFANFSIRENNFDLINDALSAKTFSNGLTAYTQSNCQVTLTDYGYRIYRPPNLIYPDAGNTMWGGLKIHPFSINPNILQKGRKYRIIFTVTGRTSNGIGAMYFTNQMGWGGGGLSPSPAVISSNGLPANFVGTTDIYYEFEINDDIYKVCTTSYSGFVAGQTYLSYRDLAWGFQYTSTGDMGTDLYLTNFRLWDITDEEKVSLSESGILYANEISEIGVADGLIAYYPLNGDALDYSGNNRNGSASGSIVSQGVKDLGYYFDGINDTISFGTGNDFFPLLSFSISVWFKSLGTTPTTGVTPALFGFTYGIRAMFSGGVPYVALYKTTGQTYVYANDGHNYHDSAWHNLVMTCDGKLLKLYLDGVYQAQGDVSAFWDGYTSWGTDGWNLGRDNNDSQYYFKGNMSDLRIYNRELSPEEISISYDLYKPNGSQMKITKDCFYTKGQIKEGY